MYYFVLVTCLIGVYFTSSGASLTVDNDMMLGLKLNKSKIVGEHKDKDIIDQYAINNMEPKIESITHSEHKIVSDEETEDSKMKPGTFSKKSFLNVINEDIDNHGPSRLDGKNISKDENENRNEGHEDIVIDEVDIQMPKETESESQESESNNQQTYGLSSYELLKQHGSSPIKLSAENVKPVAEGNTGYVNILEEIYDDEDLQYILNITHNLDTMRQSINNETHDEHFIEPSLEDVIDIRVLENATNIEEESADVDDDDDVETFRRGRKIRRKNFIKEENAIKSRIIFGDLVIKQEESATREQQNQTSDSTVNNRVRGDVPDLDGHPDKATLNFPRYLKNSSDHHITHHDDDIDISSQKEERSSKINNMNLSTDPCIHFHCKRGKTCKTDGQGNPFCSCQDPDYCSPTNRNDLVCGTDNKTYTSACHLFGKKCLLEGTKEGSHLHLDYQGPCKYIPPCTEYELMHFPFRMRDWFKNVLMQLYERGDENTGLLSEKQKSKVKKIYENEKRLQEGDHNIELLVRDFQKNYHMYVYPVHWQFHQLNQHSMDRLLTHSELAALRAPLIPIEHCVDAFLQACNTNNDRHISLWEWCHCFGIKEGDINEDLLF